MESIPSQTLNTIIMRPYFVVFFFTYLLGCSMNRGSRGPYSSASQAMPCLAFGIVLHPLPHTIWALLLHRGNKGERAMGTGRSLHGFDELCIPAWASHSMALIATSPIVRSGATIYLLETRKIRNSVRVRLLGATFFVCLDVITDPVALRGSRWVLGQIYGYRQPGVYFGVPISNFAGWFAMGFVLIWALQAIDRFMEMKRLKDW
jgi:hypothetical protein